MNAKEFLESKHIEDRVLNREDLPEFWVTISQLLNEFEALRQPSVMRGDCKCRVGSDKKGFVQMCDKCTVSNLA